MFLDVMSKQTSTRRSILKTTGRAAVGVAGISVLAGSATAHFPDDLDVDVKPGSGQNTINPRSHGITPVAVLHSDAFDPTSEAIRYRFGSPDVVADGGGATPVRHQVRDADGDGTSDVVLQFRTDDGGFAHDDEEAVLRWHRDESGEHGLSGRDEIRTVGGGPR